MIVQKRASVEDVEKLVNRIEEMMEGEELAHVNMACLAFSILIQAPSITGPQLVDGIKGASEWVALYCASLTTPKEKLN